MPKNKPIGVFDSGLGGLTSVKELLKILPNEDIIYFGDTARMPYGVHTQETLIEYTQNDIAFLLGQNVKALLAACGTISANYPPALSGELPVPYTGIIEPTVQAALAATKTGNIGLVATQATVNSGAFDRAFAAAAPEAHLTSNGCPELVLLVEGGHITPGDEEVRRAAHNYLAPILEAGVDTLVLACTHFPIIEWAFREIMGPEVPIINSGAQAALFIKQALAQSGMLNSRTQKGTCRFFVSHKPENFSASAKLFLGTDEELDVTKIDLPTKEHA
ncbi:glutamate racemase [Ruminococcaceae bacterium OttesenSCG-928-N02]|nr:glutamate racemase [Ruminococcaceae bacterium OttesenSCG-928-N02]